MKKIAFYIIAISIPFFLLVIIEFSLFLFKVEELEKLFIPDIQNKEYLIVNSKIGERFVDDPGIKPALSFVKKNKEKNEIRIVALGASTTVGFPYGHEIAFPKIIEQSLQCAFPDKQITVVNLGLTAISTFSVIEMVNETIEIEPDIILLYAGQNEFYGKYGVGSTRSGGLSPTSIKIYSYLRSFRFARLISSVLKSKPSNAKEKSTLMAKMVAEKEIDHDSKLYKNAISHYSDNLDKIITGFGKHNIPVFIGTLVTNEKDLLPFNSKLLVRKLEILQGAADSKYSEGKYNESLEKYLVISQQDSASALLAYKIADNYYALLDYKKAKYYYQKASLLDLLRFRAPAEFNQIIKGKSKYENVEIVDVYKDFESNSPNSIIGNKLLLEHVHPNITGYRLMANTFLAAILSSKKTTLTNKFVRCNLKPYASPIDSIYGSLLIKRLSQNWPFIKTNTIYNNIDFTPTTFVEKLAYDRYNRKASWPEVTNKLYLYYSKNKDFSKAYNVAILLKNEYPVLEKPIFLITDALIKNKQYKKAVKVLKTATHNFNSNAIDRVYFHTLLLAENIDEAIEFATKNYVNADRKDVLKKLSALKYSKVRWSKNTINSELALNLANSYLEFGLNQHYEKYKHLSDSLNTK